MLPILQFLQDNKKDAIHWQAGRWMSEAGADPHKKGEATERIAKLISLISNEFVQEQYVDDIVKTYKFKKKTFQEKVITSEDQASLDKLQDTFFDEDEFKNIPSWMDRDEILDKGFCAVKTEKVFGYYSMTGGGKTKISNFIIYPIFHIDKKEESQHIFDIENGVKKVTMIVPSKAMVSIDALQSFLVGAGSSFLFFGSKAHLLNVMDYLLRQFPTCQEVMHLGWQPEGFFAYVNKVYVPDEGLKEISEYGIFDHKEHKFIIPAASKVYSDRRLGEDPYENIRHLKYAKAPVNFGTWSKQMHKVYADAGLISVAFVLMTCFRDIVFSIDHNCPHLYFYGERSSGKSKAAESTTAIFYVKRPAFNLNSGTDYAFFTYMQRGKNTLHHLNEFDDKVVRDEWFQAIKFIFDGEGREKGKMGTRNSTEIQRVDGTLVLTGQYLSTKDDNSVVSRSIIVPFFERQITEQGKADYDQLKLWEAEGMTSLLTEILAHRADIKEKYYEAFNALLGLWRKETNENFNQRVFQNWAHLATMWFLFQDKVALPVPFNEFATLAREQAIRYSRFIRATDTLSEFWNTVEFLLNERKLIDGWDFKIVTATEVKLRRGDGTEHTKSFEAPKKLLYIRLGNVHKHYETQYRLAKGEKAMTFENLTHYFANREYYIGQVKQTQFKKFEYNYTESAPNGLSGATTAHSQLTPKTSITSAYVFDYDMLGCELEQIAPDGNGPAQQQEIF